MARTISILAEIMFSKMLVLILLQGVLMSDTLLTSEVSPGSLPPSSRAFGSGRSAGSPLSEAADAKSRPKRCTCYSYKDKERTVPYGMSSYRGPQRVRRAVSGQATEHEGAKTQRCICAVRDADPECQDFCLPSRMQTVPAKSLHKVPGAG
ncbi:endothelin-3b isoform X2 [Eleginops maclovinus]|uniref:endothelin-3b isoform X2 n=1 Tax=Eleginops maclovinus TaxID=56733 RepID=UPI003080B947